ncbi:putative MATE efflux family protein [Hibiscus syriacus]|uniref:MATE efflux family protein n=1 Tax=Hibiscus syriacus TaxID=106335 RepID=A0A6A2XPW7_HIBSY|nr:putative MATE efflux family protein [Hibiscus syriacus]
MLGLHLQASCIISCFFSIVISILWIYTEPIFIWLHQDPRISKTAAIYLGNLIPGLFAYGFLQNILRFLQAQGIVMHLVWFSILPIGTHFGIVYGLMNWTSIGLKGASMAASISLWMLCISLAAMHCAVSRIDAKFNISTSLIAMCVNTETIAFMFTCGLGAAASTRVANELGGGNPQKAKNAMVMTLKLSTILTLAIGLTLAFGHNVWAAFFTDSSLILHQFASIIPLLIISITFDSFQGILSGKTTCGKGCGWQHLAVWVNLVTYYFIGIPIACLLGFVLQLYDKGLWIA